MSLRPLVAAAATLLSAFGPALRADALPTFARRYQTTCVTCHRQFPRLNEVGEAFRLRGYRFVNDESTAEPKVVTLGQPAYQKLWPEAVWPSDIPLIPPVSARLVSDLTVDTTGSRAARTQFEAPRSLDLYLAGTLGQRIAFWGEVELEADDPGIRTETGGWVQFTSLLGTDGALSVRAGRVGAAGIGFFTARDGNRPTWTHYLHSRWRLPYPEGFTLPNGFRLHAGQPGIEVLGSGRRWQYVLGVVNGGDGGNHDLNSEKDVYGQFAVKLGGMGLDGSPPRPDEARVLGPSSVVVDLFAYRGWASVRERAEGDEVTDGFWRVGSGVRLEAGAVDLGAGWAVGRNGNPYGAAPREPAASRSWYVEAEWAAFPWLSPVIRYEALGLRLPQAARLGARQDHSRLVVSVGALVRANIRLLLEGRLRLSERAEDGAVDELEGAVVRLEFAV